MKPFVWLAISLGTMLSPMPAQGPIQISQGVTSPDSAPPIQTNQEQARLPLQRVEWSAEVSSELGLDDRLWSRSSDRAALVTAINYSLDYLQTPEAVAAYQAYLISDFSLERVRRSLVRFRQLVLTARSPESLRSAVQQEFDLYQSVGSDGEGTVSFTGYFEPVHAASRVRTGDFRYPLYRLPPDLKQWPTPHPTRLELEGADGLQNQRLRGLELVWLQDRLEAYLVQVQGSARLQLTDGSVMSIGYAGRTDYPYVSIGRELVNAGKIAASDLTLAAVRTYFRQHPAELDRYLPRNNRFVFFKETTGSPATGSLRVPVTAGRSIATDKSLMPPGALALIYTQLPESQAEDAPLPVSRYVLDQDTGGAIRGAGRVDLFVGTGTAAGEQAGQINHTGQLYYLLLKSPSS
ncbi:MAG: murein transglycosylase A [Leptolyngbya sp. IPPAS B-1204]|nr:MAG: murein transglycosylase [Leptolyngbya sp. IPPAS B-1204]